MEQGRGSPRNSIKVSYFNFKILQHRIYDYLLRTAKKKLPKEVKKKVEEWKFSSGALVMCLVAYSDGQDVQTLQ
jgi:hypothetical protein